MSVNGTVAGTLTEDSFADNDADIGQPITVTGVTLIGARADNYTVTPPAGLIHEITPKSLVVSGLAVSNKEYDGTAVADLTRNAKLPDVETAGTGTTADGTPYTGDLLTLGVTAAVSFADKTRSGHWPTNHGDGRHADWRAGGQPFMNHPDQGVQTTGKAYDSGLIRVVYGIPSARQPALYICVPFRTANPRQQAWRFRKSNNDFVK